MLLHHSKEQIVEASEAQVNLDRELYVMVNNKKVMAICLVQYILLLAYHLLYSLISGTQDQTNRVIVWSFCVLIILINFGYFFKNQVKIIVLFTMLSVIVSITYIGCVMHCLAFSVVIFFTAGLILSMLLNEKFVLYWSVASSLTLVLYTLIWPGILLEMVSSMFLYYGYIMAYILKVLNASLANVYLPDSDTK